MQIPERLSNELYAVLPRDHSVMFSRAPFMPWRDDVPPRPPAGATTEVYRAAYSLGKAGMVPHVLGPIPSRAKEPAIGNPLINARADTMATKSVWGNSWFASKGGRHYDFSVAQWPAMQQAGPGSFFGGSGCSRGIL